MKISRAKKKAPKIKRPKSTFINVRPKPMKNKVGRPVLYTKALGLLVCERMANGETLTEIAKDPGIPSYSTVMGWLWRDTSYREEFLERYDEARQQQAEYYVDQNLTIADESREDYQIKYNKNGDPYISTNMENIQRSRLRIDTRKWFAEKMRPKKYGKTLAVTGEDGKPLIPVPTTIVLDFGEPEQEQEG